MQAIALPADPSPVQSAETWLLDRGWHDDLHFIHLGELPRALRG